MMKMNPQSALLAVAIVEQADRHGGDRIGQSLHLILRLGEKIIRHALRALELVYFSSSGLLFGYHFYVARIYPSLLFLRPQRYFYSIVKR